MFLGFPGDSDGKEAMQETQVQSLGQEDPLEKRIATHSSILSWRIPWAEEPVGYNPWGCKESDTTEQLTLLNVLGIEDHTYMVLITYSCFYFFKETFKKIKAVRKNQLEGQI